MNAEEALALPDEQLLGMWKGMKAEDRPALGPAVWVRVHDIIDTKEAAKKKGNGAAPAPTSPPPLALAWSGPMLLALDDGPFQPTWRSLPQADKDALPDHERAACVERYRKLTPEVDKTIQRLTREQAKAPKKKEIAHLLEHAFWVRDAKLNTALPYVVKGLFGKRQVVVMWGAPGSGKTFVVMEMACAVGAGWHWRGRRTKRGIVLYIAAESSKLYVENRVVALKQECPEFAEADVVIVPLALDLLHAERGDVLRVIETAKLLAAGEGEVVLIVIDTLAVTFGGGDENTADMGQYVRNVQLIRDETGAAVLIVHHSGKNEAMGMRGHSALLGAIDAELAVEGKPGEERILRSGKVRDGDGWTDLFAFRLRVVELGRDQDDEAITSCVIESLDAAGTQRVRRERKGAGLGKNQKAVLRVIEQAGGRITRPDLAQKLRDEGVPKQRTNDALGSLLDNGMLVAHNDCTPPAVSLQ